MSNEVSCKVGTIREIHHQLVQNGYHVTEHALRIWTKTGALSAVYAGKKAFISYADVVSLLTQTPIQPT